MEQKQSHCTRTLHKDENTERAFFSPQKHPLQTKESITAATADAVTIKELPKGNLIFDMNYTPRFQRLSIKKEEKNHSF